MRIVLLLTIALSAVCAIAALNGDDQPKFETASVKRMDRGIIHNSGDAAGVAGGKIQARRPQGGSPAPGVWQTLH
jgi:hypothetical protein